MPQYWIILHEHWQSEYISHAGVSSARYLCHPKLTRHSQYQRFICSGHSLYCKNSPRRIYYETLIPAFSQKFSQQIFRAKLHTIIPDMRLVALKGRIDWPSANRYSIASIIGPILYIVENSTQGSCSKEPEP